MVHVVKLTDRQLAALKVGADPLNYPLTTDEVLALRDALRTLTPLVTLTAGEAAAMDAAIAQASPALRPLRRLFGQSEAVAK